MRVTWVPRDQAYWSYGDTWTNEFTCADETEMSDDEWDEYYQWSHGPVAGNVIGFNVGERWLYVRLAAPGPGGRTLVAYVIPDDEYNAEPVMVVS